MAIAGSSSLQIAQLAFDALYQDVFAQPQQAYVADIFAKKVSTDGKYLNIPVTTSYPRLREWVASKAIKDLRAFSQTIEVKPYEATVGIKRLDYECDRSGAVAATLAQHLANAKRGLDDLLVTSYLANTAVGFDGVSLLNDSHPFSNSTGDNLTTSALTFSTFRSGIEAMSDFTDEDGTPLNIMPTHLLVGPAQIRTALELVGADRPVAVSNAGATDATSNVVGAVTIPNVFQGMVTVVNSPWITGNQWLLAHVSPALAPFTIAVKRAIEPIVKDGRDMTADSRFFDDTYYFSLEGDLAVAPGVWQCAYGSVTA